MKRKIFIGLLFIAILSMVFLTSVGSLSADGYSFPSTNELNKNQLVPGREGQKAPYVEQTDVGVGWVELTFYGGWVGGAWFESRIDGAVKTSGTPHPVVIGDFIYPTVSVPANAVVTKVFNANEKVEIRLCLGGERDWDFDWTTFYPLPKPVVTAEQETAPAPAPAPIIIRRQHEMTCWQIFVNKEDKFEFIFWYEYGNNNWVNIYDVSGNLVYSVDFPHGKPVVVVDLPDGVYTVKTFHEEGNILQEFGIGK